MKKVVTICFLVILGAGPAAFATTTSQIWYFNDDNPTPMPDVVNNAPGIDPASMLVTPGPQGGWDDGAWELSGEIDVILDNDPRPREYKTIHVELTWMPGILDSFLPDRPLVGVEAAQIGRVVTDITHVPLAGSPWTLSIYDITIWPNPPEEWIAIKGNIVVDELSIDTECVPEPATMGLLGLGSLALLRYRRKR